MRIETTIRLAVALVVAVGAAVLLSSSDKPAFTAADKAFYADQNLINFVRPGLVLKIISGDIAADGTMKVRFKLTDPKGLPLDREGITTPGAINVRMLAAYIPKGKTQYVSYATRTQTSPITNRSAVQASTDSGGVFQKVAEGEYIYTFATKAPAGFDKTATHAIGVYATRDLAEFDLAMLSNADDEVYTFVPDGSKVTVTRDVIRTQSCNRCHDPLALHGGSRRTMEVCVFCHTPQTVDPDTGNTVDMPVMIHKIHRGEGLPSVVAGRPYQIIGICAGLLPRCLPH
jgi:OmcA/MtrC family decaheme c-type cytochrome